MKNKDNNALEDVRVCICSYRYIYIDVPRGLTIVELACWFTYIGGDHARTELTAQIRAFARGNILRIKTLKKFSLYLRT